MPVRAQIGFFRSRAGRGFLVFAALCACLSAAVGYGFYHSSLRWYEASRTEEKRTALALADAFFSTFSEVRGRFGSDEVPVPATFRAHAIERFNQLRDPNHTMRLALVGVPGREIRLAPSDDDMAAAVRQLAESEDRKPTTRRVTINDQPFLRTLHPSIANQSSCVECHNAIQVGRKPWQLNEVMGAFALDAPLAAFLRQIRYETALIALAVFVIGCGIGLYVFLLQFRELASDIQRQTHRRLTDAIENLADGFAVYDSERRLVIANAAHGRYARFHSPPLSASDGASAANVAAAPAPVAAPQEVKLPDETWVIVKEVQTASGDVVRIDTDISALKQREHELVLAKLQAERANRAKSNFLALMSHELRTPLNAINGFSEVIAEEMFGPVDRRYRNYAADINQSGQYLLSVINDILDMAKIEAGKLELAEGPVELSSVISGCVRLLHDRATAGGISLTTRVAPRLRLMADEMRLRQMLLNLLTNALKFTPAGGSVCITAMVDANGAPTIRVVDTGVGMSEDEIPKALIPFQQADPTISRKFGGTGLGLPLSKVLTELHGGTLAIESERGKGTSVTVCLPAERLIECAEPAALAG